MLRSYSHETMRSIVFALFAIYWLFYWREHRPFSHVYAQSSTIREAVTPKWEKTCLKCDQTAVQNFLPVGQASAEKSVTVQNKPFIDIRLRPGIVTPLSPYGPLRASVTLSLQPKVHNVSLHRNAARGRPSHGQRGPAQKIVTIGPAVPEICSRTDRYTQRERQTHQWR